MDVDDLRPERTALLRGALAGGTAWIGGLAVTAVILSLFLKGGWRAGDVVLTYSLLHVWPAIVGGFGLTLVFWVVPLGILFGSGYWVKRYVGTEGWVETGVAVTVGYLPLSALSHGLVFGPAAAVSVPVFISGVAMPMVIAGLAGTFGD